MYLIVGHNNTAVRNVSLRNAIMNGDFGGGELDDTDHTENYRKVFGVDINEGYFIKWKEFGES